MASLMVDQRSSLYSTARQKQVMMYLGMGSNNVSQSQQAIVPPENIPVELGRASQSRIKSLEKSIRYMQESHSQSIQDFHLEIARLQSLCCGIH